MEITYLFGAGASYNSIPVVKDLTGSMKVELDKIEGHLKKISDDDSLISRIPTISPDLIEHFKNDYNWVINESKNHQSIDTFAKKLFLQGKFSNELKKLKTILTIYFILIQSNKKADQRYDSFFASILKERVNEFPQSLKILSWNYDYQFEKAYSEYSEDYRFDACNDVLNIISKNSDSYKKIKDGFGILKLNGTASFALNKSDNRQYSYLSKNNKKLDENLIVSCLQEYYSLVWDKKNFSEYIPSLSFAWEHDNNTNSITDKAIEFIKKTKVLVIIGYSFPIFNREVDKKILLSMGNLEKVYFQAPDAENLKQRFLAIKDNLKANNLFVKTDVDQFVFPNEFQL